MTKIVVTSWLGLFTRLANLRLPVAPAEPAKMDVREIQLIATDLYHHVDAVAGSEFLDDRIRLRE